MADDERSDDAWTGRSTAPGETNDGRRVLNPVEWAVAVLGFPVIVTLAIGSWISAVESGIDPNLAATLLIVASFALIALTERLVPWQRTWLHSRGDLRTDIGLALSNGVVTGVLTPLALAGFAVLGAAIASRIGVGLWPDQWPWIAQLALALTLGELGEYGFHRAMHEIPALWRLHATHHSSPRLYWLNAARFHPIDLFLVSVFKGIPLMLLGAGLPVFAVSNLFSAVHGAMQHANVPVRLGPLNWIFSMSELHRWHHSKHMAEANHNYGGNLILWDVVFGTRWLPEDRDPPEAIGIEALPAFPMGFWANLVVPFRWARVEAEARAVSRSDADELPISTSAQL